MHLIDIENLCGEARPTLATVQAVRRRYLGRIRPNPGDLIVIGCNHGAALNVGLGWPGVRLVVGSGPDGADLRLLDVIADEGIEARFDGVVIASGDGIFTAAAASLAGNGLRVFVVSRTEALANRLRLAAQTLVVFPADESVSGVA